jgi:hypothetical protein
VLLNAFETTGRQFRNQAALPETHRKAANALGMNLSQLVALFQEHGLTAPFEV